MRLGRMWSAAGALAVVALSSPHVTSAADEGATERNVREGFAATAAFESIVFTGVPSPAPADGSPRRVEVRALGGDLIDLRLLPDGSASRPVGFVFGNLRLDPGQSIEVPFGIAAQPHIAGYDEDLLQDPMRYALAFEPEGQILDYHDLRIGVERVAIERLDRRRYRVRLVSHERILPVWEGTVVVR